MAIKFTEKTQVIFFDLEFISKNHRDASLPSLRYNPFNPKHKFLGGVFEKQYPDDPAKENERKEFWLWEKDDDEKQIIQSIFDYFKESWQSLKRIEPNDMDLITCGIGIARMDIPVLLSVALKYKIANEEEIFEYLAKTKVLDFSEIFIPYIKSFSRPLYPEQKGAILGYYGIKNTHKTGNINKLYEDEDYHAIKERTNKEVDDIIAIYGHVQSEMESKNGVKKNKGD